MKSSHIGLLIFWFPPTPRSDRRTTGRSGRARERDETNKGSTCSNEAKKTPAATKQRKHLRQRNKKRKRRRQQNKESTCGNETNKASAATKPTKHLRPTHIRQSSQILETIPKQIYKPPNIQGGRFRQNIFSDRVVSDKGRFRQKVFKTNVFQTRVVSDKGRFRQRVASDKGRFRQKCFQTRVVSDTGSFQTWVVSTFAEISDEEIWNQNSGPEGQNFDSKSPAPHT